MGRKGGRDYHDGGKRGRQDDYHHDGRERGREDDYHNYDDIEDPPQEGKKRKLPKYDPSSNGPIKNRSCTDIICCVLFCIFFLGMVAVAVLAFARGNPERLIYPRDSNGNFCGLGEYSEKPNLFFFNLVDCATSQLKELNLPLTGCPTPQVCIKECPTESWTWAEALFPGADEAKIRSEMICKEGVDATSPTKTIQVLVEDEDCAPFYLKSAPVLGRCVPSIIVDIVNKSAGLVTKLGNTNITIKDKFNNPITGKSIEAGTEGLALLLSARDYAVKVYQDVRAVWWLILVALAIAMLLSLIWIILMRWIAGPMVWITIVCFVGLFIFATYYCIDKYLELKDNPAASGQLILTINLDYYAGLSTTWLVLGCIAGVVLLITLILLLFLYKRILIAISLIQQGSKAVGSMVSTLFFPLIPFVFEVGLFTFWGASTMFLASTGEPVFANNTKTRNDTGNLITETLESLPCQNIRGNSSPENSIRGVCEFVRFGGTEYSKYLQFYQLFMLFWCMNFIVAFGQLSLAGAFASYYWAFNKKKDIPTFPLAASMWRTFRYHLGTIAFGSLIIAIVQIIRVILEYIDHKLKKSESGVAKFLLKCLKCCMWCLEKFLKFLNKNAYIMCAIYGKNFCVSAKNAFTLILANIVRVAVVDKVTDLLLLFGKLLVVAAVGALAYFFFNARIPLVNDIIDIPILNFNVVPVIIICAGSYIIASAFFSVYGMAVDTLFLCFLEDLERHDGSKEKPYYMSKGLMKILGKKNKKEKKERR